MRFAAAFLGLGAEAAVLRSSQNSGLLGGLEESRESLKSMSPDQMTQYIRDKAQHFGNEESFMREIEHRKKEALGKMTDEKALDILKTKMSPEQRHSLSLLLSRNLNRRVSQEADEGCPKYADAMNVVNGLYLDAQQKHDTMVMQTWNSQRVKWNHIYGQIDIWKAIGAEITATSTRIQEQEISEGKAQADLDEAQNDYDGAKRAHADESAVQLGKVAHAVRERSLIELVLEVMNKECTDGGSDTSLFEKQRSSEKEKSKGNEKSKESGALLQKSFERKMSAHCEATCADRKKNTNVNQVLLDVFTNPKVKREVEFLDNDVKGAYTRRLGNLRQAVHGEKVHPKYSMFLQKKTLSGQPFNERPSETPPDCGCGGNSEIDCEMTMVILGLEWACRNQGVLELQAQHAEMKAGHDQIEDDKKKAIEANKSVKTAMTMALNNYNNHKDSLTMQQQEVYDALMNYWNETWLQRQKDYLQIFSIRQNEFCATMAIRNKFQTIVLEKCGLQLSDIRDCQVSSSFIAEGTCDYVTNPTNTDITCQQPDESGQLPAISPMQKWVLRKDQEPGQEPAADAATGNITIALQCPKTQEMMLECGMKLCSSDCTVSDFGEFSKCTKQCDGGIKFQGRQVIEAAKHGGAPCPELFDYEQCNTDSCDEDCVLQEFGHDTKGCLTACTVVENGVSSGRRQKVIRNKIHTAAKGNGECPPPEERQFLIDCSEDGADEVRECFGDEICNDRTDLVIVFDASMNVNRLGHWTMTALIEELLVKIPTFNGNEATSSMAVVVYGNGKVKLTTSTDPQSGAESTKAEIAPAVVISPLKAANEISAAVEPKLYKKLRDFNMQAWNGEVIDILNPPQSWTYGFSNLGNAMSKAEVVLENGRPEGVAKKILIVGLGKRTECGAAAEIAHRLKNLPDAPVTINSILFAPDFDTNPGGYTAFQELMSFPPASLMWGKSFADLLSADHRTEVVTNSIPTICPGAVSPTNYFQKLCKDMSMLMHQGRHCNNWTKPVTDGIVSLQECAQMADAQGFKAFSHGDGNLLEGSTVNCLVHEEDSKKKPFITEEGDQQWQPDDSTCTAQVEVCDAIGSGDKCSGWFAMSQGGAYNHYAVMPNEGECLKFAGGVDRFVEYFAVQEIPVLFEQRQETMNELETLPMSAFSRF